MEHRENYLTTLFESNLGVVSQVMSPDEQFQNQTLRPILKFQNQLLLSLFIEYCKKQKNVFFKLPADQKIQYITHALQRDLKFRSFIIGIVVGLFTLREFEIYAQNVSNCNKRISNLIIERLSSQLQLIVM